MLGPEEVDATTLYEAFPWLLAVPPRVLSQVRRKDGTRGTSDASKRISDPLRRRKRRCSLELRSATSAVYQTSYGTSSQPFARISLGAASRIQGMTPAALAAIAAHVRKGRALRNDAVV